MLRPTFGMSAYSIKYDGKQWRLRRLSPAPVSEKQIRDDQKAQVAALEFQMQLANQFKSDITQGATIESIHTLDDSNGHHENVASGIMNARDFSDGLKFILGNLGLFNNAANQARDRNQR